MCYLYNTKFLQFGRYIYYSILNSAAFAMSDDSEEEMLMMVDLQGITENDWENCIGNKCKIIGIDTDEPVLQLDQYIFRGNFQDIAGTAVLFEEVSQQFLGEDGDTHDSEQDHKEYKYKFCTHKKLLMQRAFLKEKENPDPEAMSWKSQSIGVSNMSEDGSAPAAQHASQSSASHTDASQYGETQDEGQVCLAASDCAPVTTSQVNASLQDS